MLSKTRDQNDQSKKGGEKENTIYVIYFLVMINYFTLIRLTDKRSQIKGQGLKVTDKRSRIKGHG